MNFDYTRYTAASQLNRWWMSKCWTGEPTQYILSIVDLVRGHPLGRIVMPLIEWTKKLSVNIAEIDTEHRRIIEFINELDAAMKQGKGKDVLGDIITGLMDYTVTHFKKEENYFEQFKYPKTFAHQQEHKVFIRKVSSFKKDLDQDDHLLSIEVLIFLSEWLVNHINGSDKKYGKLFNDKGLV